MARKFDLIDIAELQEKIENIFSTKGVREFINELASDIKVEFDLENFSYRKGEVGPQELMGFNTFENGLTFCGMCAGGDWEFPVFFIVYWDGKKLRGYVPTYGNPWNLKTKQAYGNNHESDLKDLKERCPELKDVDNLDAIEEVEFDSEFIKDDIMERIVRKS